MLDTRHLVLLAAATFVLALFTMGVNRIVVTDGQLTGAVDIAFKSDYFPLDK